MPLSAKDYGDPLFGLTPEEYSLSAAKVAEQNIRTAAQAGLDVSKYGVVAKTPEAPLAITTENAADLVRKTKEKEQRITPPPAPTPTPAPEAPTPEPEKPVDKSVTLTNLEDGRELTFDDATLNKPQIQGLLNTGGWTITKGNASPFTIEGASPADEEAEETARLKKEAEDARARVQNFDVANDPALKRILDSITAQWDAKVSEMREINRRRRASMATLGVRLGSRYTGGIESGVFGGVLSEEERQGLMRVEEIQASKQQALTAAQVAYTKQEWDKYVDLVNLAEKRYENQLTAVAALNKVAIEERQKIEKARQDEEQEFQKSITDISLNAAKIGAPTDTLQAISEASSVGEAIQLAGNYLQTGSGIVGEYIFYKRQAETLGQVPLSFDDYQTRDANRKISLTLAANANAGGMNTKQQTIFNQIVNNYQKSPLVAAADRALTLKNSVENIKKNPELGAAQLSLIYGYIQALDQYQSAVREGEIALNQSLLGIRGKLDVYASNLENKRILDKPTALNIAKDAERLVKTIDDAAKRKEEQFKSQARVNGIENAWNDYRSAFTASYEVANEIINDETQSKQEVIDYGTQNPDMRDKIKDLAQTYNYSEIKQILGI